MTSPWTASLARTLSIPIGRARLVEGFLRSECRTLNHLSEKQIVEAYAEIGECIDADPEMADCLASSYGL